MIGKGKLSGQNRQGSEPSISPKTGDKNPKWRPKQKTKTQGTHGKNYINLFKITPIREGQTIRNEGKRRSVKSERDKRGKLQSETGNNILETKETRNNADRTQKNSKLNYRQF